jgi:SPP1 family predicted phage head-tail adaptor
MPAGKYRDRITVQQPTRSPNEDGQMVSSWSDYNSLWAAITHLGGDQAAEFQSNQQQGERRYRIEVRQSSEARAITHKMRISYRGRTLHVAAVDTESSLQDVIITATEKPT